MFLHLSFSHSVHRGEGGSLSGRSGTEIPQDREPPGQRSPRTETRDRDPQDRDPQDRDPQDRDPGTEPPPLTHGNE